MADSSDAQEWSASTFWIAPVRNFRTSARLHLQHLLFQNTLGFLLEPTVQESISPGKAVKVADIACGNGIWLLDLDRELSNKGISAQLDGFDINPINLPAAHLLPKSVNLKTLDILAQPLPEALVGVYDVVHVRAFSSIVVNENVTPLLSTALALLKPGGWLQWEEADAGNLQAEAPPSDTSKASCDAIVALLNAGGKTRGTTFDFIGQFDNHLTKHGFEAVKMLRFPTRRPDLKGWTEDYLMVWEEIASFFPSQATAPQAPMTKEAYVALFQNAVEETEKGVVIHNKQVVAVVGRKPS